MHAFARWQAHPQSVRARRGIAIAWRESNMTLLRRTAEKFVQSILTRFVRKAEALLQADLPRFGNSPNNLTIQLPRRITNPDRMYFGDNVSIGPGAVLTAQIQYPGPWLRNPDGSSSVQEFDPRIFIGNRVTSTGALSITALSEVRIEDDVMFAPNVMISDGSHGYETANQPYKYQKMWKIAPVTIRQGCWIGQNVVILPGVTIGELSIIGSNSVVTTSIPARSIAAGAPARVIKYWDDVAHRWSLAG